MTQIMFMLLLLLGAGCQANPIDLDEVPPPDQLREPVVAAYLPDYRMNAIDPDALWIEPVTDLIYFGLVMPEDGVFKADAINPEHLQTIKTLQRRSGCRLLLCIGGWGRSDGFSKVAADPTQRAKMIESLATLCQELGFDGIDYDWEHPQGQEQLDHYALLIEQTAIHFAEHNLLVSVAQASWQNLGRRAYDSVDRVHLMSYDQDHPHATPEQSKQEVERLIEWGCPPGKIALGIPFYGRNQNRVPRSYAALADQADLDPATDLHEGYAFNGPETVGLKTNYALERGLAGVMIWEVTLDHPKEQTLLRAIAKQLDANTKTTE